MEVNLYNHSAENIGKVKLPDAIFAVPMNSDLLYQVVTSQMSNRRQVVAHTKGRSEVRGGGIKPWRQKGTGRARHGSIRSPIWKGGGVTFGPTKEVNFKKKINLKMANKALLVALSAKTKDSELIVVDQVVLENLKTKEMALVVKTLSTLFKGGRSFLFITANAQHKDLNRVSGNLPGVFVLEARNLNALDVLSNKNIVFLKKAVEEISNNYGT